MKLSVCYILKNEGQTIYKSLDSIKSFVNEYIIGIDDSCNDNTEDEINKFFKDNPQIKKEIYKYTWKDNFAEARNEGMDKASGAYILIMDGHEIIPEEWFNVTENKNIPIHNIMPKILEMIEENNPDEAFFSLYQQPFQGNLPNNHFMQPRIYRNGIGKDGINKMRFGRAAHNCIKNSDPDKSSHFPEVIIIHNAPEENRKERNKQRTVMNIKELKKDLKINPKDTRALFYIGNTYMEAKNWDAAIKSFEKYIAAETFNNSQKYQVYFHMALCYQETKDDVKSLDCLHQAIRIDPQRRDAYIICGDICVRNKEYDRSLHYFNSALMIKIKPSNMFSNTATATWAPYQRAAYSYAEIGDMEKAVSHLKRAMRFVQIKEWDDLLKKWTKSKKNILIIDNLGSFTKDIIQHLSKNYNVNLTKSYDNYLAEWADIIWQEWGDNNLLKNQFPDKTIIRIHGYEAYLNIDILNELGLDKFRKVIFVAKHIQEMFPQTVQDNSIIIHNGVDIDKFYIKEKNRNEKTIGIAGFMNVKKNPMRLANYINKNPNHTFHLRIEWQDKFLKKSFEYETKDCKNIVNHGRYEDLNDFWNQVKYVISTSDIESFSYNIAEAMAAGCHPLIYPWMGAENIWGKKCFIKGEVLCLKTNKTMQDERNYIIEKYSLANKLNDIEQVIIK